MVVARHLAVAAVLVAGVAGCKNSKNKAVAPTGDEPIAVLPSEPAEPIQARPVATAQKIQVLAAFSGLEDLLAASSDLAQRMSDEPAVDPLTDLQAMLLQTGFAPAFLDNIDLDAQHAVALALPATEQASPDDFSVAGTLGVVDGRKMIEAIPAPLRPQPVGGGVWEFQQNGQRLLLKEAGKELYFGMTQADLQRAAGLRDEVGPGRRIRARAWDIPTDQFDPAELLGLPGDLPLSRNISKMIKEAKSVEFEADFGMKRDLEVLAKAHAPFSQLGIEPLGKPRTAATAVENVLPGDPMFVTTMSWGDPELVHKLIDKQVPVDRLPGPLGEIARKAIQGTHQVLDAIADDVALALYVDRKGATTLVLAASVKDDAKTMTALRSIHESMVAAIEAHADMQGKNAGSKFAVSYKPDGLKLKGVSADQLSVTIAKDFRDDLDVAETFVVKDKLEVVAFSHGKTALLAIGPGARSTATEVVGAIGKSSKASLGGNTGLSKVRTVVGGCQICVSLDAPGYLAYRLHLVQRGDDKKAAKDAGAALKKVDKLGEIGDVGFGVRVTPDEAAVAVMVPESVMFAPKETLRLVREVDDFVGAPTMGVSTEIAETSSR